MSRKYPKRKGKGSHQEIVKLKKAQGKNTMKSTVVIPPTSLLNNQVKIKPTIDILEVHKQDYISLTMIGHSYVSRLRSNQIEYMKVSDETMSEAVNLNNTGILPHFYGRGGVMVHDIPLFVKCVRRHFPEVVLLDIGQNDLCWNSCKPEELAQKLYLEIQLMFESLECLKLVTVCQVLKKWEKYNMKGDKKIQQLNDDIDVFNYEFFQLSRRDRRVTRWTHKGLTTLTAETSTDGTHPNTIGGYWRYLKSVSVACKISRKEMFLRRGKSIWSVERRRRAIRKVRSERRQHNKMVRAAKGENPKNIIAS